MQLLALTRFHWAAGARVALRANAMVLATVVFIFGSAPDGLATLRSFLLGVVARDVRGGSRGIVAVIAAIFAATAVRRVLLGANGWLRALPTDARTAWRAAVGALSMAQMAVVTFIPLCVITVAAVYHRSLSVAKIVSLPIMIVAVAATVLPPRRWHTRGIAAVAVAFSIVGTWPAIVGALLCLVAADSTSPALAETRRRTARRGLPATSRLPALAIWIRSSWRAMRLEGILGSAVLPAMFASYAYFITRNNPEMPSSWAATVVRVCGILSVATFAAMLANVLLSSRQPWPWARSLPWSSTRRVVADAIVIGAPMLFAPLALLPLGALPALAVASLVPLAAATAAAAQRGTAHRQTGAAGECAIIGLGAGAAIAAWPVTALLALAVAPLMILIGARRERDAVAERWMELHHDAAGDPGWLGGA